MWFAVVKLVRGHRRARRSRGVINKFVALALGHAAGPGFFAGRRSGLMPGFAAIVGALDHLPEPTAGLRRVNSIGISRRSFEVIHLPAGEMRPADVPFFALAVRCKNECALACAHQYPYLAHLSSPLFSVTHIPSFRLLPSS